MAAKVKIKDIKGAKGSKGKEAAKVKGGVKTDSIAKGIRKLPGEQWRGTKSLPGEPW